MSASESRISVVRRHFEEKGYRVHSGLQFGVELVLYADAPHMVHSDFCVHVLPEDGNMDWRRLQTLVRSMPDLHKTLVIAYIENGDVKELCLATEHAPFRHRQKVPVGGQQKTKP